MNHKPINQGFTLLEMIMVMLIFGILVSSLAQLINLSFRVYQTVERNAHLTYLANTVLQQMAREIRLATPHSIRITQSGTVTTLKFHKNAHPVRYVCNLTTGEIIYYGNYFYSSTQKTGNLLVNQVSACDFTVVSATQGKLIKWIITLTDNQSDVKITLFQQFVIQ